MGASLLLAISWSQRLSKAKLYEFAWVCAGSH
jgi:hypothetical protein